MNVMGPIYHIWRRLITQFSSSFSVFLNFLWHPGSLSTCPSHPPADVPAKQRGGEEEDGWGEEEMWGGEIEETGEEERERGGKTSLRVNLLYGWFTWWNLPTIQQIHSWPASSSSAAGGATCLLKMDLLPLFLSLHSPYSQLACKFWYFLCQFFATILCPLSSCWVWVGPSWHWMNK